MKTSSTLHKDISPRARANELLAMSERMRLIATQIIDDQKFQEDTALWEQASLKDFAASVAKHKL